MLSMRSFKLQTASTPRGSSSRLLDAVLPGRMRGAHPVAVPPLTHHLATPSPPRGGLTALRVSSAKPFQWRQGSPSAPWYTRTRTSRPPAATAAPPPLPRVARPGCGADRLAEPPAPPLAAAGRVVPSAARFLGGRSDSTRPRRPPPRPRASRDRRTLRGRREPRCRRGADERLLRVDESHSRRRPVAACRAARRAAAAAARLSAPNASSASEKRQQGPEGSTSGDASRTIPSYSTNFHEQIPILDGGLS